MIMVISHTFTPYGKQYRVLKGSDEFVCELKNGVLMTTHALTRREIEQISLAIEVYDKELALTTMRDEYIEKQRAKSIAEWLEAHANTFKKG